MANLIQIRRSNTTTAPASLANGEIAYSFANTSNTLWIGDPRNVVPGTPLRVAGGKYAFLHQSTLQGTDEGGVLTANAVVITNANNFLDQFKTNTIVVGPDGTTNAAATLVVSGTANISGNTTVGGTFTVVGTTGFTGNVAFDTNTLFVDSVNNRVGILTTTPDSSLNVNGTANVAGNTKISADLTVTQNTSIQQNLSVINSVSFSNTLAVTGNVNFSNTLTVVGATTLQNTLDVTKAATFSNTANIVGAVTLSNTFAVTGNATFSNTISVTGDATFTSNVAVDTNTLYVDTVNNRVGILTTTPDASLNVNGTANVAGNTTIVGKLLQVANATFSNTIAVTGNATFSNTIAVTGNATFSDLVTIAANTNIDSGTFFVDTVNNRVGINDTTPSVALDVTGDIVATANLTANNLLINADATINGNLSVNGTLTTIDTVNLVVEDPLFKLGKNNNFANTAGDAVDLGFYGMYANTTADFYTGLFRDSSDGKYKLFKDLEAEPTTVVDTANATFKFATLNAYLEMGGFTANSTNFVATANSTYNVTLTANTLTLSNKLAVTEGGTGVASFTTNGVLFGNGTANLQVTSAGTFGDVLQVNVSGVPVFGTLDGGTF
jgi:hypothetical protein